jgi:hypothetical protein
MVRSLRRSLWARFTYNAKTANDTRSQLGARFDDLTTLDRMPLILRSKLAWGHDWVTIRRSTPCLNPAGRKLRGQWRGAARKLRACVSGRRLTHGH